MNKEERYDEAMILLQKILVDDDEIKRLTSLENWEVDLYRVWEILKERYNEIDKFIYNK